MTDRAPVDPAPGLPKARLVLALRCAAVVWASLEMPRFEERHIDPDMAPDARRARRDPPGLGAVQRTTARLLGRRRQPAGETP